MLNHAGRLELVISTLASISIFAMMSLDVQIEIETLLAIEKILRFVAFCGKAVRMCTVATVWWCGTESVC
jgi:hypothetical protein